MHARLERGRARDELRTEITRLWIGRDAGAAVSWMKSLDDGERRAAAIVAATELAPYAPQEAMRLVEQFGLGREQQLRKVLSGLQH
jgi:hypothetical protein